MPNKEEEHTDAEAAVEKRKRGRPRKPQSEKAEEPKEKQPRGRPKGSTKNPKPVQKTEGTKRSRGRPKKEAASKGEGDQ